MKLKTSFFNSAVLKKDITRFAPLWGLYTVFMLLFLFLIQGDNIEPARFAADAPYIMMGMGVVNFVYAGLCAILLFGDLFTSKMCNALHAMPMRREGWFLTHLTAGVLFCVGPNALGTLIACVLLQEYCYLAFLWLAVVLCQFLFFFGVGAFSTQCAGNRLGSVAVYGLFNFLAVLLTFLTATFYTPLLYGMKPNWEELCRYSPTVGFTLSQYVSVEYNNMSSRMEFVGFLPEDWRYLFIALAIGLVLLGAAVLLYRRRQMESAGDFIAVKPAAPVFLILYTLCAGAALYFIADVVSNDASAYLFLVIGFAIGFFTGWMLLEKKVNVFKPKRFIGFGVFTLAFFLTIAVATFDPLGITRYVPDADQVKYVTISPYASDYFLDERGVVLTEREDIEAIVDIHSDLVENRTDGDLCIQLRYELKDGRRVERKYFLAGAYGNGQRLKTYLSRFEAVTGHQSIQALMDHIYSAEFYSHYTTLPHVDICPASEWESMDSKYKYESNEWVKVDPTVTNAFKSLLSAIEADCQEGTMAQNWEFHPGQESVGNLTIRYITERHTEIIDITVFADCKNTIAYLKSLATE
jgi:ABC-2 type transport system permease protein